MTKARRVSIATEGQIQRSVVTWLHTATKALYFHTPNEGKRTPAQAFHLQRMGMRPGVPDLTILTPCGKTLWWEPKTPQGRLTEAQDAFRAYCLAHGHHHAVVRSLEQAMAVYHEMTETQNA